MMNTLKTGYSSLCQILNPDFEHLMRRLSGGVLKLVLFFIILPLFIPFSPKMPALGVDTSWALGLNQAVAQGLSFGKQIIFTLGPYSSIYTKAYHPATDLMMLWGSFYLACSYWFALVLLIRNAPWYWVISLCIFLMVMVYAKDSLFFSYPLLVGLIHFRMLSAKQWEELEPRCLVLALLLAPLGLLPLIKGSLLILSILTSLLSAFAFIYYRQKINALLCLLVPIISLYFFWFVAGQTIGDLPSYIVNSIMLAADFTQAMSTSGNNYEVIGYLIASFSIFLLILSQRRTVGFLKLFLFSLFFIFLFLSFKTGFTRHFGHAFIAGTSVLIAALLVPFCIKSKLNLPVIVLVTVVSISIDGQYTHISIINNVLSTYSSAWHGFLSRAHDKNWARQNYLLTLNYLRDKASFPRFPGKTDVYSYGQTALIASENDWSPRPVFQSYSVFNAWSAAVNKQHLLGAQSPDTLFFKMEPIDGRMPALEDGLSWPVLISHYRAVRWVHDFLVLQKRVDFPSSKEPKLVATKRQRFGDRVMVPNLAKPVFVALDIKPKFLGILAIIFYKPASLSIHLELDDGTKKHFRMIASMAESGFLISPLIENTNEFSLLYGQEDHLVAKQVKSFIIAADEDDIWQWRQDYLVHFKAIL